MTVCVLLTTNNTKQRVASVTLNGETEFFSHSNFNKYCFVADFDVLAEAALIMAEGDEKAIAYKKVHTMRPKLLQDVKVRITEVEFVGSKYDGLWEAELVVGEHTTTVTFDGVFSVTQPHRATVVDAIMDATFAYLMHCNEAVTTLRFEQLEHPFSKRITGRSKGQRKFQVKMDLTPGLHAEFPSILRGKSVPTMIQ